MRPVFSAAILLMLALVQVTYAECNGFTFTVKSHNTPIYKESREDSAVIRKLSRGDTVCYVGQEGDFAILDEEGGVLTFARYSELAPPEGYGRSNNGGLFQKVRDYYYFLAGGGVPEDPFYPLRPILRFLEGIGIDSSPTEGRKDNK